MAVNRAKFNHIIAAIVIPNLAEFDSQRRPSQVKELVHVYIVKLLRQLLVERLLRLQT